MTNKEFWMPVKRYQGIYEVSSIGRIRRIARVDSGGYFRQCKILRPYAQKSGYLNIKLRDNHGKRHNELVHRLVASAFVANPAELPQVNHKNEIVEDNRVENLEWCTAKYNLNYGHHRERQSVSLKNNASAAIRLKRYAKDQRIPVNQIDMTGNIVAVWPSMLSATKQGFKATCISDCCRGKQKTHHGFRWELVEETE